MQSQKFEKSREQTKKKKRRERGQILTRDIFDIKVRKNTKEGVYLILTSSIWPVFELARNISVIY